MAVYSNAGRKAVVSVVLIGLLVGGLPATVATDGVTAQQAQPETDNTVTRIEVADDGSARWTIQIRTRLDTDQRVAEYTAFQARFRNDTDRYLGPFQTRIRGVVENAANATGREMRATNFTASTSIQEVPRRWGIVTYEFTWTNFAAQENEQVIVGDVFEGGFFIAANDTLQLVAPEEYEITEVDPGPDSQESGTVIWNGREDFADTRPAVVFAPESQEGGGLESELSPTTAPDEPSVLQLIGGPAVLGLLVVSLLGFTGAVLYRRRSRESDGTSAPTTADDGPPPESATPSTAGGDEQATETAVLTDEEKVLDLLETSGGRLRQAAIADEFDWSASKTSRVVGRMAAEGSVQKLQLGRENLVALPDEAD